MAREKKRRRPSLILASGSPRRQKLLSDAGVEFAVIESGAEEAPMVGEAAEDFAARMARDKALMVSRRAPDDIVLAADTVVEIDGVILGKPEDERHGRQMLERLSGRSHTVITAFAMARGEGIIESEAVQSRVTFKRLSREQIDDYLADDEPFDKAGAYGAQGKGGDFIARVAGSFTNVMGLPMDEVLAALRRHRLF